MAFPGLKKNCERLLQESKQTESSFNPKFVEQCYQVGGKGFVEAIKKWGVNERGEKLNLLPWHCEYAELIGDFRVAETLTSGCAQVGKTLLHTLLLCYCLTEGGLNTLWSYDLERSLNIQVPSNFRPVITKWLEARGIKPSRQDAKNNQVYQVKGATSQFLYVSTSEIKESESGKAAVGGIAAGVSRDLLFKEERSQYPPGASDPLNRRLDAGRLPSRPIRELGTPGAGNGIEAEIKNADYNFYPHYKCPHCDGEYPLHPKGCLLRPNKDGEYLSKTGRPLFWWTIGRENPTSDLTSSNFNPKSEATFSCSNCGTPLSEETRKNAWFRCTKTGINLKDLLSSLPKGEPRTRITAAITLSPLLRFRKSNLAQELISEGLKTINTSDWQQQALGEESQSNSTGITLAMLKHAIKLSSNLNFEREPDFVLCGIDQGRREYWLFKVAYYLPDDWKQLSFAQRIEQARRRVLFGGDITKDELLERIEDCDYGVMDAEPDVTAAVTFAESSILNLADQQSGQLHAVKEGLVYDGGSEHPCWKIRNEKFLKAVLEGFLLERYCLPIEWEKWHGLPTDERSPLVHLKAPSYEPSTGRWRRPKNHVDDLYYAAAFCEAAFYIYLLNSHWNSDDTFDAGAQREVYESLSGY